MRTLQGGASAITAGPHTPCLTLHQRVERFRPARKKKVTIAHAVDTDVCKWDAETHLVSVAHAAASPFAKTPGRPRTGGGPGPSCAGGRFLSYCLLRTGRFASYRPLRTCAGGSNESLAIRLALVAILARR